jgi:aminoglycoside/choline kinase family phosphotransferase
MGPSLAATERQWYLSGAPVASQNVMNLSPSKPHPNFVPEFGPLRTLIMAAFPDARAAFDCTPMPGGASTRRYFRVRAGNHTAVAMFVPDGPKAEEVIKGEASSRRWPFLEVRELLAARGVDVPALYGEATGQGWLLLEDLGDDTLASVLLAHPDRREELYVRAVADLGRAQVALSDLPPGCVVSSRAFDDDLLSWEMHHFREWGLEARGIVLSSEERSVFDRVAARLARRIAAFPRVFVHRDYQSRNLMVRRAGSLCWIDFQDALLGPRIYDLVALLNDSYQKFDRRFVEARLDDYARSVSLGPAEREALGREFDLVTIQRKLKDAGRFVFIDRVKGNDSFLKFVEPTIAKAAASAARLADDEDVAALSQTLARVLPR